MSSIVNFLRKVLKLEVILPLLGKGDLFTWVPKLYKH